MLFLSAIGMSKYAGLRLSFELFLSTTVLLRLERSSTDRIIRDFI